MLNKILLALFVLFILTLLGWCSPQCSRIAGNEGANQPSATSSDSGSATTTVTEGMAKAPTGAAASVTDSGKNAAEIAAEAASTTLDISKDTGPEVVEVIEKTVTVETQMSDEPVPQPTDFAGQTSLSPQAKTADNGDEETGGSTSIETSTRTQEMAAENSGAKATSNNTAAELPASSANGSIAAEAQEISAALTGKASADDGAGTVVLEGVNFETNSDHLTSDSIAVLDLVAESLKQNEATKVEIAGYTDNTGDPAYNVTLSQRRANAVVDYLTSQGVSATQLSAKGYGAASPIADNSASAGRKKNRRVEMHVMK